MRIWRCWNSQLVNVEEWDIETAVSYAAQFMTDLPRQWRDYSLEQKHKFQQLVFPEGVIYKKGAGVLELKLGAIYQLLQDITNPKFDIGAEYLN